MNVKAAVANSNEAGEFALFSVNFSSTGVHRVGSFSFFSMNDLKSPLWVRLCAVCHGALVLHSARHLTFILVSCLISLTVTKLVASVYFIIFTMVPYKGEPQGCLDIRTHS